MAFVKLNLDDAQRGLVRNMFRLQYSLDRIALAIGTTEKRLNRYLRSQENKLFHEQCKREKVLANVFVRESLYKKAVGVRGKKGRPKIIQNGAVVDEGQTEIPDVPGDLSAQRMWLEHRDSTEKGDPEWGRQQNNGSGPPDDIKQLENKSDRELVDFIVQQLKEAGSDEKFNDQIKKLTQ